MTAPTCHCYRCYCYCYGHYCYYQNYYTVSIPVFTLICLMVSVYVVKHHERRRHAVNMSPRTVQLLLTMQCPMEM